MRGRTFADTCALVVSKGGPQSSGTRAEYVNLPSRAISRARTPPVSDSTPRRDAQGGWMWKLKIPAPEVSDDLRRVFAEFCAFGGGTLGSWRERRSSRFSAIAASSAERCARRPDDDFRRRPAIFIFTKVRPKGERVVEIEDFALALRLVADEIGATYEDVHDFVVTVDGPSNTGTKAEYNKFYDDKEMYTGAYAAQFGVEKPLRKHEEWRSTHAPSPPPDVPGLKSVFNAFCVFGVSAPRRWTTSSLSSAAADSRLIGRKFTTTAGPVLHKGEEKGRAAHLLRRVSVGVRPDRERVRANVRGGDGDDVRGGPSSSARTPSTPSSTTIRARTRARTPPCTTCPRCKSSARTGKTADERRTTSARPVCARTCVFCSFRRKRQDMNIKIWAKLVNETGLVGRRFNMTSADIIFSKVAEGRKLLEYEDFLYMLDLAAEEKRVILRRWRAPPP